MKFVIAAVYDNYISANLAQGLLESENINCWLKDELTVTVQPFLTNAMDGIKLMVAEPQIARAQEILRSTKKEFKQQNACPKCGSANIEYVSSPRKSASFLGTIAIALLSSAAPPASESVYHCFDCGHEYESD